MTTTFWTGPIAFKGAPIDHLGLGALGQSLADITVPGLTNGTDRARVFTVAAWIARTARSRDEMRRLENAWITAVRHHTPHSDDLPDRGVVGIRSARDTAPDGVDLDFSRNVSLFDAQSYGPSAVRLGAIGRRDRGALRHTPGGDVVAQRLAGSLAIEDSIVASIRQGQLGRNEIEALGTTCVCQRPRGDELEALTDLFLRLENRRSEDIEKKIDAPRRAAFLLLLDALDSSPRSMNAMLDRVAGWATGTFNVWRPSHRLERCAFEYSAHALRSLFKGALESLWCLVLRDAEHNDARLIDVSGVAERVIQELTAKEALSIRPDSHPIEIARALAAGGPEIAAGFEAIDEAIPGRGVAEFAGRTVVLTLLRLAGAIERLADRSAECRKFMSAGAQERVPLMRFLSFVEAARNIGQLVHDLIHILCVHQHLETAARKFGHGSADGFFLSVEHGGIRALPGSEEIQPVFTGIKIRTLFRLARDLGFCSGSTDAGTRTDAGTAVLHRGLERVSA